MKKMILFILVLGFSANLWADNSVGCGLGTLVAKDNTLISATTRSITNATFSSQLFGITTGTSGCARHSIVQAEKAPMFYAEANLEQLKIEMAQGQGEFLNAFASTFGCTEQARPVFNQMVKENYSEIFKTGNEQPHQMLDGVKKIIEQNEITKNKCQITVM